MQARSTAWKATSAICKTRNNVVRTTGLDFPLPEGDVEQQARMMFSQLAKVGALTILED